ncbi:protein LAX PANICLE 2 [Brachypodium distachyon]|uniref:Uncharacterized protein n=1 Tax=Brachypodium distachyon TaxID=15368 RepID=A0A2K2DGX2_BRADI|nr:protein LAX PANICLE 2 [Brachypodium distachyon]XP_024314218.1 protein LAX PANICLE 2 [Brachypodium distachyon]XP_024314219.1 protein LAX PANICLE 2 [Brachypodium distachyon]PNT73514.1 hypothetical protein BRADI_2g59523v3 [Brachypodium distachyon]|eukprot:XP_003567429.1 protein LAX PANICLE 2 [Brachypodium distachyon]
MVPTTRRNLPRHDSGNKNNSKLQQHCSPYYIAAQLEAAAAPSAGCDLKPSRRFPRLQVMAAAADDAEAAAGTSSRSCGGDGGGKDWLQLGLATASSSASTSSSAASAGGDNDGPALAPAPAGGPMELDQFAGNQVARLTTTRPPLNALPIRSYHYQYGHGRYHPPPPQSVSGSIPTTVPFLPFARPLRSFSGDLVMRVVGPPPPRAEVAGLWLTLQADPNQIREPILPQIPKSYLRIRDGNMKVEVVMKYMADKLGLTQSHQVELACRGHLLPPFLLMKYVRDCIWCGGGSPAAVEEEDEELPRRRSQSPAPTDHVMTLFYSTKCRDH